MMRYARLLGIALATVAVLLWVGSPAGSDPPRQPQLPTLTGNSGKSLEEYGIRRDIYGTWMGRASWNDLARGNWLMAEESGVPQWRRDHFDRALDVGTPLVPTDSHQDLDRLLREAASGAQDATYRALGACLARYGTRTVYARLWWEFNMPPAQENPRLFVQAWRRAVPLLRQGFQQAAQPGQKLRIVWCTNAGAPDPEPFYPGDAWVDVIGSDVYGWVWGDADPSEAQLLNHLRSDPFMLEWLARFAERHHKPTCLGEWGNIARKGTKKDEGHGLGDCPAYIDAIYDWAATCRYGCRYICYFNLADGGVGITLDQTPLARERLKARAAQARLSL